MPAPIDLTGSRFGSLLVLGRAGTGNKKPTWLCLCDCGTEDVIPSYRLPYTAYVLKRRDAAWACFHCRWRRVCIICGATFESKDPRKCCSPGCHQTHRRAVWRAFHWRRLGLDPGWWRQHHAKAKARWAADPEKRARHLQVTRRISARKLARIKANPERLAKHRAYHNAYYHQNHAAIWIKRAARIERMSACEFIAWKAKARQYQREYRARWRKARQSQQVPGSHPPEVQP